MSMVADTYNQWICTVLGLFFVSAYLVCCMHTTMTFPKKAASNNLVFLPYIDFSQNDAEAAILLANACY